MRGQTQQGAQGGEVGPTLSALGAVGRTQTLFLEDGEPQKGPAMTNIGKDPLADGLVGAERPPKI